MEALLAKIDFFEAFFKVHYTKGARLSYPMPLPTSVVGMFGAMLGWERNLSGPPKDADGFLFGSKILSSKGSVVEQATYAETPKNIKGVAPILIINEPSYLIAMAGEKTIVRECKDQLLTEYAYLPYGGQNDFFVKDINIVGVKSVKLSRKIENYAPKDFVKKVELEKGASIYTLPVMHSFSLDNIFYFVDHGARIILKKEIPCVEGIGLYSLSNFHYVVG